MNIRTETAKDGRTIAVELSDTDGQHEYGSRWTEWSLNDRFRALSAKADMLLVFYMAQQHMVSPDYARTRTAALRQGIPT